jgi:hypothetical protein
MLGTRVKDDLINIAMEGMIREVKQLINAIPVIVDLLALIAEFVLVGVFPCKDTRSSGMEQVTRAIFGVAGYQTSYYGSSDMVTCISSVCFERIRLSRMLQWLG